MKKIIRSFFAKRGFVFRREKVKDVLPVATLNTVELLAHGNDLVNSDSNWVVIGAFDGRHPAVAFDRASADIPTTVFVEPQKLYFEELAERMANKDNVKCFNVAIGEEDGVVPFYSSSRNADSSSIDQEWASFSKSHLKKLGLDESEIKEEQVETWTFETLLGKAQMDKVDVLIVDTEGFDAKVVLMALNSGWLPKVIYFEHIHLSKFEIPGLYDTLKNHSYRWSYDRRNTFAIKE